jgi:drug/metabolite transporter (DMT)-like permease
VGLLAAACACWALDNNLTQHLTLHDPFAVVRVKVTVAGLVNTTLGLATAAGASIGMVFVGGALILGSLCYGVSVVLDAYALRHIGAAREGAYFAMAPFVGVLIAIMALGDSLHWYNCVSMAAMALGVVLLLRERHSHTHEHGGSSTSTCTNTTSTTNMGMLLSSYTAIGIDTSD